VFPHYKGQRHFPGRWWSATMGGHVGYESWLERDHLMMLDFDPAVVAVASQPFWLFWTSELGKARSHAPDYFARLAGGGALVLDCRPVERIKPRDAAAFAATVDACEQVGWSYRVSGATDVIVTRNVRWLAGYCHPRHDLIVVAAGLRQVFAQPEGLMAGVGADLLKLIDERLATKHQVIYTTHSPFMVSPKHFERVRTVIDHLEGGTKVSEEIFKADTDTAFPLAAMGIEMTQTLFVADDTLLVEGPSDMIYLDIFNDAAEAARRTGLDQRWVVTPIGGAGKLSTFAALLVANKINVAVLVDSSTKDVQAVQHLRANDQLAKNGLIEIKEFTGTADADIEDVLDRDFYIELVNRAYASELPAPITAADLNARDPRIVRQIEAYFQKKKIAGGKFNHYKPARTYLREQASLPDLDAATLDRIEKLFQRLNGLIRKTKKK
jgi:hypothetical protein